MGACFCGMNLLDLRAGKRGHSAGPTVDDLARAGKANPGPRRFYAQALRPGNDHHTTHCPPQTQPRDPLRPHAITTTRRRPGVGGSQQAPASFFGGFLGACARSPPPGLPRLPRACATHRLAGSPRQPGAQRPAIDAKHNNQGPSPRRLSMQRPPWGKTTIPAPRGRGRRKNNKHGIPKTVAETPPSAGPPGILV